MAIKVVPSGAPVGAEIQDITVTASMDDATFSDLMHALHTHSMIFVRNQDVENADFVRFGRRLGSIVVMGQPTLNVPGFQEITRLSNIFVDGKPEGLFESGQYWHTDRSFHTQPQGYAILHSIEVPHDQDGNPLGDTLFVSTAHAYDTLPADIKARIQDMRAMHSYRNPYKTQLSPGRDNMIRLDEHHKPETTHPVVRTHPITGRKCLYVNHQYTESIEGLGHEEGRELIDYLCQHIIREEARYRHRWSVGDVVMWDDCAIQHHAVGDYNLSQRRLIHRIAIQGTAPF